VEEELVAMYVSSIRNAMDKTPKDNSSSAQAEAEALLEQANALSARYSRETSEDSAKAFTTTVVEFSKITYHQKDTIPVIIGDTVDHVYHTSDEHFQEAHALYEQAIEKFGEVPGNACQDRIEVCEDSMRKSDKLPLKYRQELYDKLNDAAKQWERNALMGEGEYVFHDTCTETDTYMESVYRYVDESLPACEDEEARQNVKKNAIKMVEDKASPGFDLAKRHYNDAKDLCDETKDKVIVDNKVRDVNNKLDNYRTEVSDYVTTKINEIYETNESTNEDLLTIYHEFSTTCAQYIQCLRPVGQVDNFGERQVNRQKGAEQYRLEKLLEIVRKSHARDCELRKKLHVGTDQIFDAEGLPL